MGGEDGMVRCGHDDCKMPACVELHVFDGWLHDGTQRRREFPACSSHLRALGLQLMEMSGLPRTELWIYPGERRPVVVEAPDHESAVEAVKKSPDWDGFGPTPVMGMSDFVRQCAGG